MTAWCKTDPQATYLDPVIGWRCWRVQRVQTHEHGQRGRFRLCAAGTQGLPKVWQPRVATAAVCSDWNARHEAPHPRHACGIYAYADRETAEAKMLDIANYDRGGKKVPLTHDTWAFGRVQLWGRIVECELGWRGQYAYPYELTVYSNGQAPTQIAADYAVEVTRAKPASLKALLGAWPVEEPEPKSNWYETSIYGIMDSSFLRPYHQETTARLKELRSELGRIAKAQKTGAPLNDGPTVNEWQEVREVIEGLNRTLGYLTAFLAHQFPKSIPLEVVTVTED